MTPPEHTPARLRCVVVGATGYSGAEAVSILLTHPRAAVVGVFGSEKRGASDEPERLGAIFPRLRGRCDLPVLPADADAIAALAPDAAFLATPHAASHDLAPALVERGVRVLDLSAAFRLRDPDLYPRHYGFRHARPDLLERAVYGIPELHRERMPGAPIIAVAGCYPTSAIIPLAPLIDAGAIDTARRPIIDSTSGVSGAGRHATLTTSFCEVSLQPYAVLAHRHAPEIEAGCRTPVVFTPHLASFERGILSTIHAQLAPGWDEERARALLAQRYGAEPFVRLLPPGQWPSVGAVRHTNFCDIALAVDGPSRHLIIVSAIDNLVKGAAGQAVQCMNAAAGLPETLALLPERSAENAP